jgi:thiamine pyrophosphokinase
MKKKWAVIITGGYAPGEAAIRAYTSRADYIIAADSGFDIALEYQINVDFVVGDMDSIQNKDGLAAVPRENKKIVSHEKDETDTELALDTVWNAGYRNIVLIGGGGGRLDHIIGILCLFEREKSPKIWVTDSETVYAVEGDFRFNTERGEKISLFPISGKLKKLYSEGLKWNLTGLSWKRGDMGISNEATGTSVRITAEGGKLLMIRNNSPGAAYV